MEKKSKISHGRFVLWKEELVNNKVIIKDSSSKPYKYYMNPEWGKDCQLCQSPIFDNDNPPKVTKSPPEFSGLNGPDQVNSETPKNKPINIIQKDFVLNWKIRKHNLLYSVEIIRAPAAFKKKLDSESWLETIPMTGWRFHTGKLAIDGILGKVHFKNYVIVIWLNDVFGSNPYETLANAENQLLHIKGYLEDKYKIRLSPDFKTHKALKTKGSHNAILNHRLAEESKRIGFSYRSDNIEVDASKGTPEKEYINSNFSALHCMNSIDEEEGKIQANFYFHDLVKIVETTTGNVNSFLDKFNDQSKINTKTISVLNDFIEQINNLSYTVKILVDGQIKEYQIENQELKQKLDSLLTKKSFLTKTLDFLTRKKYHEEK